MQYRVNNLLCKTLATLSLLGLAKSQSRLGTRVWLKHKRQSSTQHKQLKLFAQHEATKDLRDTYMRRREDSQGREPLSPLPSRSGSTSWCFEDFPQVAVTRIFRHSCLKPKHKLLSCIHTCRGGMISSSARLHGQWTAPISTVFDLSHRPLERKNWRPIQLSNGLARIVHTI